MLDYKSQRPPLGEQYATQADAQIINNNLFAINQN